MALTPAEQAAQIAGYTMPEGLDLITDGDDAIRRNAVTAHQGIEQARWTRGTLPAGNVSSVYSPGQYLILGANNYQGLPDVLDGNSGLLTVYANGGRTWGYQEYVHYGNNPSRWWRVSKDLSGSWNSWAEVTPTSAPAPGQVDADAGLRHQLLASDFRDRIGSRRIAGKAAIVFRFDHYLNVYRDQIRPLMTARGFKATIAMNSRTWDAAQNDQVTPAEADSWTDVEFANHGAHHSDASTDAALYDTIALGQSELQAQLPNHAIDGFIVPGVGGTQYGGWGTGSTLTSFADYEAGRLMLGHHAYSTGSGGSVNRKMDGQLRQGLSHYGIESRTFAPVKAAIDSAVASNSALTLMMHPDRLGTTGNISVADLTQIFDYVKALVDAGDVEVLTLGESLLADSTRLPVPSWDDLTGKPATYPSTIPEVDGLQAALPRIDTTVGTRVLLGDVMIHGETGKRDVTALFTSGLSPDNTGRIRTFRRGSRVVIEFADVLLAPGVGSLAWSGVLGSGWRPHQGSTFLAVARWNSVNRLQAFTAMGSSVFWTAEVTVGANVASTNTRPPEAVRGQIEYDADGWPSSLPGDPA